MNAQPLLIATDEAGYGPKLGPLVVTATVWRLPIGFDAHARGFAERAVKLAPLFAPLAEPFQLAPCGPAVRISDSKQVFKARHPNGLVDLESVVQAAVHWVGGPPLKSLSCLLEAVCPGDGAALRRQPWFSDALLSASFPASERVREIASEQWRPLHDHWQRTGLVLVEVAARVIDAAAFNARCAEGFNKAEILSEATTGLVAELLDRHQAQRVQVYCDRHGGRRYYGGVLQHARPLANLHIEHESAEISCYRQQDASCSVQWQFTVKGDSFPPVALSSIVAKYLRERMMGCFNAYWQTHHTPAFKPTAGYPQDADRFLAEIEATRQRLQIEHASLCRQR